MKLIELLEGMEEVLIGHDQIKQTTICTLDDVVTKLSESKNKYIHAMIVYDQQKIKLGEWTQGLPLSLIFSDKMKADESNKLHIHSNTLSASVELTHLLRQWLSKNQCEGLLPEATDGDLWSDQYGDGLYAGLKLDFKITAGLGGFCEIL